MTSLLPCFKVKVKGRGQGHGSRSRSTFLSAAVDIRGSALPNATKSKEESLSVEGVCLCVEHCRYANIANIFSPCVSGRCNTFDIVCGCVCLSFCASVSLSRVNGQTNGPSGRISIASMSRS